MAKKEILFHVGLPKTGTSTIQTFLVKAAADLAEMKAQYPFDPTYFGSHVPRPDRRRVPPQTDALCHLYTGFAPVTPSTLDWGKVVDDFLHDPDCERLILSHESQARAAHRLKTEVFADMAARADLRFLAYLREPVSWLTSLHAQNAYGHLSLLGGRLFPVMKQYATIGYLGMLAPFKTYGKLDLRDYDALRKTEGLLPDFLSSIDALSLAPVASKHRNVNIKKAGRDTVLLLLALKTVMPAHANWWSLTGKLIRTAEELDTSSRAFFPADLVTQIRQKWAEECEIFARDYGLQVADTPFPEVGPEHLSIDPEFAAQLKETVFPDLSAEERDWMGQAFKLAIAGSPNPYRLNAAGSFEAIGYSWENETTATADPALPTTGDAAMSDTQDEKIDFSLLNTIARSFWTTVYQRDHPEATREEIQAAWLAAAPEYRKIARTALKKLERNNIRITS